MKSNIKSNFIYNLSYNIFTIIVPLITTPYVSRKIGAVGVGDYAYAYSIANYFSLFIKLGLNNYGNRTIAYARDDKKKMSSEFWNIYCFQFILSIVIVALYLLYSFFIASNHLLSIYLVLFVISSGLDITWFYWGMEEFKITVTRSFIIKILSTAAIFLFVKDKNDTGIYTLILSFSFFASQFFLWPILFKYVDFVKPQKKEVVKHIRPNLILFLPAIAVSFYKIIDKIMLGLLSSTVEVGYYESSEKIVRVPIAVIESLGTVMQPRMSNMIANKTDENYTNELLKKSVIFIEFLNSIVVFGIMTMANEFVPVFYGPGFDKCIILFRILLPSCLFLALTNVFKTQYLLPRKMDREYTIALFTGAGVNLVVNSLLIPHYASVGVAIGTLLAEASVCLVIAIILRNKIQIMDYISPTLPFIISGLIMFIAGFFIDFSFMSGSIGFIVKTIVCGLIYLLSLLTIIFSCKSLFKNKLYPEYSSIISSVFTKKK